MDPESGTIQEPETYSLKENLWYWTKFMFVVVLTVALGFWIFNMFIDWRYNAQILAGPCQTCVEVNPEWKACYDYLTKPIPIVPNYSNLSLKWVI